MARVFTTSFLHEGKPRTAVITQLNDAVNIYVPDESLHDILPQGRATLQVQQQRQTEQVGSSPAQNLIQKIMGSIGEGFHKNHLKTESSK